MAEPVSREVDLDNKSEVEIELLIPPMGLDQVVVLLPLDSFNVTNSHIDICEDLLQASWVAERLASCSKRASAVEEKPEGSHRVRFRLTLEEPTASLGEEIRKCAVMYRHIDEGDQQGHDRWLEMREVLIEYEENLGKLSPRVPEIVEQYLINYVTAAQYQMRSDAPEYYQQLTNHNPEYQVEFYRSPYSERIGATCYTSMESWLVPAEVDVDHLFRVTGQSARIQDFMQAEIVVLDGRSYILAGDSVAHFPMNQYFRSRVCASFAARDEENPWPLDAFAWKDASFTFSEEFEELRSILHESIRGPARRRERCLLHQAATLAIIDDGQFSHILYEIEPLNPFAVKDLHAKAIRFSDQLWSATGPVPSLSCEWSLLDDEQFEQLCYDLIFVHPKFDSDTIRKLGKSRSRDGGRDIEVRERTKGDRSAKKWLFQCKLITNGASLTGTRLVDIGDMLEMHEANGFGVMTSAMIDATLYDKMDKICNKRGIVQLHFSLLELERALIRNPEIRSRYFTPSTAQN